MAFFDNLTKVIDGQVHFNEEDGSNLIDYLNQQCKERGCSGEWSLPNNTDVDCDCIVARMYWGIVRLAEWENRGINLKEFIEIINQDNLSKGVELIKKERERQINVKGWTAEHDAQYKINDELAHAAATYALPEYARGVCSYEYDLWPWDLKHFKPTPNDRIRELTKAGALIAAEIDRLLRERGE